MSWVTDELYGGIQSCYQIHLLLLKTCQIWKSYWLIVRASFNSYIQNVMGLNHSTTIISPCVLYWTACNSNPVQSKTFYRFSLKSSKWVAPSGEKWEPSAIHTFIHSYSSLWWIVYHTDGIHALPMTFVKITYRQLVVLTFFLASISKFWCMNEKNGSISAEYQQEFNKISTKWCYQPNGISIEINRQHFNNSRWPIEPCGKSGVNRRLYNVCGMASNIRIPIWTFATIATTIDSNQHTVEGWCNPNGYVSLQ